MSERQREGERWALIRRSGGITSASPNQATKRGYMHRERAVPRGTSLPPGTRGVPPHAKLRDPLPQARPMTGRRRLDSYGAQSTSELTGPQRRRFNSKMNRQLNRSSGIARTLRGRERPQRVQLPQPAQPENLVAAAETKSLLRRINEVWRRDRNLQVTK